MPVFPTVKALQTFRGDDAEMKVVLDAIIPTLQKSRTVTTAVDLTVTPDIANENLIVVNQTDACRITFATPLNPPADGRTAALTIILWGSTAANQTLNSIFSSNYVGADIAGFKAGANQAEVITFVWGGPIAKWVETTFVFRFNV